MRTTSRHFVSVCWLLSPVTPPPRLASRWSPLPPLLSFVPFVSFVFFVSFVHARPAEAQPADAVGVRAQGMGGAFTALADDATATWWNPAGLAGGSIFSGILEFGGVQEPAADPAWRSGTRSVSIAVPALGISYYRLRISEIRPITPTEAEAA